MCDLRGDMFPPSILRRSPTKKLECGAFVAIVN